MNFSLWLLFSVAYLGITFSPGPNIFIVFSHAAKYGFKSIFIAIAGNLLCQLAFIAVIAFGVGSLLTVGSPAYVWMKYLGAVYLIYMGIKAGYKIYINKNDKMGKQVLAQAQLNTPPKYKRLLEAILVSASNPKTVIFLSAFLPQFVTTEYSIFSQFSIMFITMSVCVLSVHATYAYLLLSMKNRMTNSVNPKLFPSLSASIFILLGVGLGVSA